MSLQDALTAAQAGEQTAKEAYEAAAKAVAEAQSALDAAAPHLSVLGEIEDEASKLGGEVQVTFLALVAKAKALF